MIDSIGIDSIYAASTGRKMFLVKNMDDYDKWGADKLATPRLCAGLETANLVSSEVEPDKHLPVLDMDFPIRVIPSSTEGHGHLYIDKELTWEQYTALLEGFHKAGLIQDAWYRSALNDKRSYVRLPHIKKRTMKTAQLQEDFYLLP